MALPLIPLILGGVAIASTIAPISSAVGRKISPPTYNAGIPTPTQTINKGLDTLQLGLIVGGAYLLLKK